MLQYIIQVVVIQAVFLAAYDLWLRKETFFKWNRIYLLSTLGLSFVIPYLKFSISQSELTNTVSAVLPEIILNPTTAVQSMSTNYSFMNMVEFGIYAGIIVLTFVFIYKLSKIVYLIGSGEIIKKEKVKLVLTKYPYSAFTFFNFIFINETILKHNKEIIEHEMVHCREKHTLDLILIEILKIFMWFNPLVYLYHKRITELHEFISDDHVIQSSNKEDYMNTLLGVTFNVQNIAFINQFYKHSLIKKRIVMMTKEKSKQIRLFRYLSIVPLVAGLLFYVSCSDNSAPQEDAVSGKEMKIKIKDQNAVSPENESVSFTSLEEVPRFKGATGEKSELKRDFQQKLTAHVIDNFNFKLGNELHLEPDTYRIIVSFIIDKEGNVSKAKAKGPRPELEQEAIRVVKSLPQLEPGMVDGKAVSVNYAMPIAFKVE